MRFVIKGVHNTERRSFSTQNKFLAPAVLGSHDNTNHANKNKKTAVLFTRGHFRFKESSWSSSPSSVIISIFITNGDPALVRHRSIKLLSCNSAPQHKRALSNQLSQRSVSFSLTMATCRVGIYSSTINKFRMLYYGIAKATIINDSQCRSNYLYKN